MEPEASPAMSIPSDDDTDFIDSDSKFVSEHDSAVDMRMEGDVDALHGIGLRRRCGYGEGQ